MRSLRCRLFLVFGFCAVSLAGSNALAWNIPEREPTVQPGPEIVEMWPVYVRACYDCTTMIIEAERPGDVSVEVIEACYLHCNAVGITSWLRDLYLIMTSPTSYR